MSNPRRLFFGIVLASLLALVGWQGSDNKLDDAGLKSMLAGLGYEVKEAGPGTYEIAITTDGLNIPVRTFITKNRAKVWLSVALMKKDAVDKLSREDLQKLLEANVTTGPSHFMIEGGWLKLKMPFDNRAVAPLVLRNELDYLSARVSDTKALWQK